MKTRVTFQALADACQPRRVAYITLSCQVVRGQRRVFDMPEHRRPAPIQTDNHVISHLQPPPPPLLLLLPLLLLALNKQQLGLV